MVAKLFIFLSSIVTLQCSGYLPTMSDVMSTHKQIHSRAQQIADSIIEGLSQEFNMNFAHSNKLLQRHTASTPGATIVVVVEDNNYEEDFKPTYHRPPPHHRYPPHPHHRYPPPPHHNYPPPPPPPYHKHPPPPMHDYNDSKEDFNGYEPHHHHFENQNWYQQTGGHDNKYDHQYGYNHHRNDGYSNDNENDQNEEFTQNRPERPNQEYDIDRPVTQNDNGTYEPNGYNTTGLNQNQPPQSGQELNQNRPTTSDFPKENEKLSTSQSQNKSEVPKDSKDDNPFLVPLKPDDIWGQTNTTAPKRDADNTKSVEDDDDDKEYSIDVRFKGD